MENPSTSPINTIFNHSCEIPLTHLLEEYPLHFCDVPLTQEAFESLQTNWFEIGGEGFWSLSSEKEGNGIRELRDNNPRTFWQSDAIGPHVITVQFPRFMKIARIDLLLNYKSDESYTPETIIIKAGHAETEMSKIKEVKFQPERDYRTTIKGDVWFTMDLEPMQALKNFIGEGFKILSKEHLAELTEMFKEHNYIEGFCVQIVIVQNHFSGKDSHVRQVRIYGPSTSFQDNFPSIYKNKISSFQDIQANEDKNYNYFSPGNLLI